MVPFTRLLCLFCHTLLAQYFGSNDILIIKVQYNDHSLFSFNGMDVGLI